MSDKETSPLVEKSQRKEDTFFYFIPLLTDTPPPVIFSPPKLIIPSFFYCDIFVISISNDRINELITKKKRDIIYQHTHTHRQITDSCIPPEKCVMIVTRLLGPKYADEPILLYS